jgi:hypothetical protein
MDCFTVKKRGVVQFEITIKELAGHLMTNFLVRRFKRPVRDMPV